MKIIFLRSFPYKSKVEFDFLFPIFVCKNYFKSLGYEILIKSKLKESLADCDILCVLSSCLRYNSNIPQYMTRLEEIIKLSQKTYFFDISDSAGILYEDGLEMFDLYYKKQINKDKSLYTNSSMKDPRFHVNKYINNDNTKNDNDNRIKNYSHVNPEIINNIRISWNVGLGDYRTIISQHNLLNKYILFLQTNVLGRKISLPNYRFRYQKFPIGKRTLDIISCFNSYNNQKNKPIFLHRKQTSNIVNELENKYSIVKGFFPKHQYYKYLQNSKIGISPFGWGEITWKDFEIFLNGLILLKPTMNHLSTWPNYFVENKTYIPYEWDTINLKETIERLFDDIYLFEEIATQGQKNYMHYNVISNPKPFIDRFKRILH